MFVSIRALSTCRVPFPGEAAPSPKNHSVIERKKEEQQEKIERLLKQHIEESQKVASELGRVKDRLDKLEKASCP